jgi:NADPH:quinone reductase-like Zn-dependent oxidoreductase
VSESIRAFVPDIQAPARIRLDSVPAPTAGPGQVVVAPHAVSVNRGETFVLEQPPADWRPGKDVAGRVTAVGHGVEHLQVGQRVVAHPEQAGWAERVAVAVDRVALLPDSVDFATAAPLGLAALTALRLTRVTGPLAARRILLTGASGGVGHTFVQLAAAHGALVTAVTADPERGARLLELGAAEVVHDIDAAAGPFDIAIESTGGTSPGKAWARLSQHGHLVWFGQASREPAVLDFLDWRGATSGTIRRFHYAADTTPVSDDLAALVRLVSAGRLQVEIGWTGDWQRLPGALQDLLERRIRGNAVLTVDQTGIFDSRTRRAEP